MFEKIIVAIGDSYESQLVLSSGLTLAEKFGAKILLLHVINPAISTTYSPLIGGMFPIVNDLAILLSERLRQRTIH